jgi:hypothetical protein
VAAFNVAAMTDWSAQPGKPKAVQSAWSTPTVVLVCETALAPAKSATKNISSFWTGVYLSVFCWICKWSSNGAKKPIRRK